MLKPLLALLGIVLSGCAGSSTLRVAQNAAIIQTQAAPVCGAAGASRVAMMSAAIETLKDGFDRFIVVDAAAQNSVQVTQSPGVVRTEGVLTRNGNYGTYSGYSTYQPGPAFIHGTHDQSVAIRMFHEKDAGAENAIDARVMLGPDYTKRVEAGVATCMDK